MTSQITKMAVVRNKSIMLYTSGSQIENLARGTIETASLYNKYRTIAVMGSAMTNDQVGQGRH